MRPIHPDLIARMRCADPTVRQYVEAQVLEYNSDGTPREHIRETVDDWTEADSLSGLQPYPNGDLRLAESITVHIQNDAGSSELTDLSRLTPILTCLVDWADGMANDTELSRIQLWLNPRRSGAQQREVAWWRLELYRLVDGRDMAFPQSDGDPTTGVWFTVAPLVEPIDVRVNGDGEGYVTFDFAGASSRPQPKRGPVLTNVGRGTPFRPTPTAGVILPGRHYTVVAVYALNEVGEAADNVAWDYDATAASVASGGTTIRGRRWIKPISQPHEGRWQDGGSPGGTPRIKIESGSYTTATVTFSADPFDVGATPTGDLELVGVGSVPIGCGLTFEVRNDADSAWVPFTDGQLHSDVGIGKTQPRKMRATLTTNGAGTLSPTLKRLGLRAVTRQDLSHVCEVRAWEEAFEPTSLHSEIPEGRLIALKSGDRDFRSVIEDLLATRYPRDVVFRCFIGAPDLPRERWLHKTDLLLGDWEGRASHLELVGLSPLVKLKDLVPPYSPGANYAPDGDPAVGTWTTLAGGTTNLYQQIDEPSASELDGVRSVTSPSAAQVVFSLPTPTDLAGRRLYVDCDYAKDQAGGEQIDLTIQLYQDVTLIAQIVKTNIGADRVQSSMELTDAQLASITTPADLRLAFSANAPSPGTGRRAVVYWARLRSGGRRETVTYLNDTLKDAYADLLDNRLALESRYRGPGIEDTTFTVSKQLTGIRRRTPQGKDIVGKGELEYLAHLAGGIVHDVQGRIRFTSVFGSQAVAVVFPSTEITVLAAGPGMARRVPEFFIPFRWDTGAEKFTDEGHYEHGPSILSLGTDTLGPPKWLDEEIAKWIDTPELADAVGVRTIQAFATGEMLWRFRSTYRYPELHIGDLVAIETDQFVARDPNVAREIRGRGWVLGIVQRADFWGRDFTIWVRGYADVLGQSEAISRSGVNVTIVGGGVEPTWRAGKLTVSWVGSAGVQAVRIATSTSAFPAAGTGTLYAGQTGSQELSPTFAYSDTIYVTITPYGGVDGVVLPGEPYRFITKLPQREDQLDPTTGKRKRAGLFDDDWASAIAIQDTGQRFRALLLRSTDQAITNDTETSVTWDTEAKDEGGLHSTGANTERITIPTGGNVGFWILIAQVEWEANATGYRQVEIRQDLGGAKRVVGVTREAAAPGLTHGQQAIAIVEAPAVGNYYEVRVRQTSGGDLDVLGDTVSGRGGSYFMALHVV